MDRQRVHAVLRRLLAAGRPPRRPARPQAPLPHRARRLHGRVAARRPSRKRGDADRGPRSPGARRGVDLAGGPVDHRDHVRGRCGARTSARGLGRDRNRRVGSRPRPRRSPDAVLLVAVDLLRECAGRHRGGAALAPPGAGVARRLCAPELRHRRRGGGDGRLDGARLRNRRRPVGRLGLGADAGLLRNSRDAARRVRHDRAARESAARAPLDLPHPLTPDGERRHAPRDVGHVRDVLLQHALPPARARLRAADGGSRVPAIHGRDHGVRLARVAVRAADRRAAGRRRRLPPHSRRARPADAAAGPRLVPRERAAGAPTLGARHGCRVHAAHADRDHRPRRRRPGTGVGALQHLAAGRRRARPRRPLDARDEQDGGRRRHPVTRARRRLPLGVRGGRPRHPCRAGRDGRAPA